MSFSKQEFVIELLFSAYAGTYEILLFLFLLRGDRDLIAILIFICFLIRLLYFASDLSAGDSLSSCAPVAG